MKKNYFITLEGIEGVGKSTQLSFIKDYLTNAKKDFLMTREPGGTPVAEGIRQVLLHPQGEPITPQTELLLMFAGRAQHMQQVILPALSQGKWVICDRFTDASYAYQGGGRHIPSSEIAALEQWVQGDLRPDYVLLLDAPVELALSRIDKRAQRDRIESEEKEFFERVRAAYLARAKQFPDRYHVIDASRTLMEVQITIQEILDRLIHE